MKDDISGRDFADIYNEDDDFYANIGKRVYQLRRGKTWSQDELADAANLSKQTISQIESGHRNMTLQTLTSIAVALGTNLRYIEFGEDFYPESTEGTYTYNSFSENQDPIEDAIRKITVILRALNREIKKNSR